MQCSWLLYLVDCTQSGFSDIHFTSTVKNLRTTLLHLVFMLEDIHCTILRSFLKIARLFRCYSTTVSKICILEYCGSDLWVSSQETDTSTAQVWTHPQKLQSVTKKGLRYLNVPCLDCDMPAPASMLAGAREVAAWDNDVYIHCVCTIWFAMTSANDSHDFRQMAMGAHPALLLWYCCWETKPQLGGMQWSLCDNSVLELASIDRRQLCSMKLWS